MATHKRQVEPRVAGIVLHGRHGWDFLGRHVRRVEEEDVNLVGTEGVGQAGPEDVERGLRRSAGAAVVGKGVASGLERRGVDVGGDVEGVGDDPVGGDEGGDDAGAGA